MAAKRRLDVGGSSSHEQYPLDQQSSKTPRIRRQISLDGRGSLVESGGLSRFKQRLSKFAYFFAVAVVLVAVLVPKSTIKCDNSVSVDNDQTRGLMPKVRHVQAVILDTITLMPICFYDDFMALFSFGMIWGPLPNRECQEKDSRIQHKLDKVKHRFKTLMSKLHLRHETARNVSIPAATSSLLYSNSEQDSSSLRELESIETELMTIRSQVGAGKLTAYQPSPTKHLSDKEMPASNSGAELHERLQMPVLVAERRSEGVPTLRSLVLPRSQGTARKGTNPTSLSFRGTSGAIKER